MRDTLPAIAADVRYNAKTIGTTLRAKMRRDLHQMSQSLRVSSCRIQRRSFGNDKKMRRRLRRSVVESQTNIVFKDDVGGDLAIYDFGENGFVHD